MAHALLPNLKLRLTGMEIIPIDTVLEEYLAVSRNIVINRLYPFDDDVTSSLPVVPDRYTSVQVDICVALINKRGAEGQFAHEENSIVRSFTSNDVPAGLLSRIVPYIG